MLFPDSHEGFRAQEGWLGCPHCERPVDARLALLRAKQRALRDLSKLLRDTGVKAAATLRTLETAIAALADDEARQEEGWYPDLAWPPAPEDED